MKVDARLRRNGGFKAARRWHEAARVSQGVTV
jgi:hypothetical protein